MSFVSIQGGKTKLFLKLRKSNPNTASVVGYLSVPTGMHCKNIDIQIDVKTSTIRVRDCSNAGIKVSRSGQFSCTSRVLYACDTDRIYLKDGEDGWLYGRLPSVEEGVGK